MTACRRAHIQELRLSLEITRAFYWDAFFRRLQIMINRTITAPMPARIRIVVTSITYSLLGFDFVLSIPLRCESPRLRF
jgi:hypothetical protein